MEKPVMSGYLNNNKKEECFGCEACAQACPKNAITMIEDNEGFRYPVVDLELCTHCNICHKVCPKENFIKLESELKYAFGGYNKNINLLAESTSGGAFSAIVESWCDENYVIFGAAVEGLNVYHAPVFDKAEISRFRKSKYLQSEMGSAYIDASYFLKEGKSVLFSGTPCQIAGLKTFLQNQDQSKLLTIEVICEGVPTPHFIRRYDQWLQKKYTSKIQSLDYRYKDIYKLKKVTSGKWDFQVMYTSLESGKHIKIDRWLNPFWSIWLNYLMSRPSCYECPFANAERKADISLGDLWGVHIYCPELYGNNTGSSLIICNTKKGRDAFENSRSNLYGHELDFETATKYQSPMRKHIIMNPNRDKFMQDVVTMDYKALCKKWAKKPTIKLLWQKYVWGNRQKVWIWYLKNRRNIKGGIK